MTGGSECRYCRGGFTAHEMVHGTDPVQLDRHALSKAFRRRVDWVRPDDRLKDMMTHAS